MDDVGAMLKSPYVWIGGAVLGGLILLTSKDASAAAAPSQVAAGITPAYLTATVQMNTVAMGTQVALAEIDAERAKTAFGADVASQSLFYNYITDVDNNNTILAGKFQETQAGVANALISSSTAIIVDRQQNDNRLALAYVDAQKSFHTDDANVSIARYSYKGQKAAANASMVGSAIGGLTKIAGFL